MAVNYGSLPFEEQIAFFRQKLNIETRAWTDIYTAEHDHAFMVSGAMKRALVEDFRAAIEKAIEQGTTLAEFRRDFDAIVQKHGWAYNGGRGWRTRVIYDTNMRQSYNAGRVAQMKAISGKRPYWRYKHNDSVAHPRPQHLAWDGLILRHDDPFWQSHTPANGWGCRCYIETLAERDMKKLGKAGPDQAPPIDYETRLIGKNGPSPREVTVPVGIDPGFEYQPGESWLHALARSPQDAPPFHAIPSGQPFTAIDPLPPVRKFGGQLWDNGMADEEYVSRFLAQFGATIDQPVAFTDVAGDGLVIGKDMFWNRGKNKWKVTKFDRAIYLPMLAELIKAPDEIWTRIEWHHATGTAVVRRRYVARFEVDGQDVPGIAVFEEGSDGWWGVTTFQTYDEYLGDVRNGIRVYRRKE